MGNVQCCAGGAPRSQLLKAKKKSRGRGGRADHNGSGSSSNVRSGASPVAAKPHEHKSALRGGSRTMRRCELQSAVESTQSWLEQCLTKVADIRRASLTGIGPMESLALKELDEDLKSRSESVEQLLLRCHDYLDANNYQDVAFDIDVGTLEKSWRRCQQSVERMLGRRELGVDRGPVPPASFASTFSCSSSALSTSTTESDSAGTLQPRPSRVCKPTGSDNRAFAHTDGATDSASRKYVPHLTWQYRAVIKNVSQRKCKPRSSFGRSSICRSRSTSHSGLTSGGGGSSSSSKMACSDAQHTLAVAATATVAESRRTLLDDRHRGDGAEDAESCWAGKEAAECELRLMKNTSDGVLSAATSSKMSRSCAFHEDLHAVQSWADGHDLDESGSDDGGEPVESCLNAESAVVGRLKRSQGVHEQLSGFAASGAALPFGAASNIDDTQSDAIITNTSVHNPGFLCDDDASTTDCQSTKTDCLLTSGVVKGLEALGPPGTYNPDDQHPDYKHVRSCEYHTTDGRPVEAGGSSSGHVLEDQPEDLRLYDDYQSQALSDFLLQYNSLLCWLAEVKDSLSSQVTDNVKKHLCYFSYMELSQLSSTERWQRLEQARQSLTSLQPEPLLAVDRRLKRLKVVCEQLSSDLAACTWRSCSFEKILSDAGHELDILKIRLQEAETAWSCLPVLFDGSHLHVEGADSQLPELEAEQERVKKQCRAAGAIAKLGQQLHALLLVRRPSEHFGSTSAVGLACIAPSPSDDVRESRTRLQELAIRAAAVEQEAKCVHERWLIVWRLVHEQQGIAKEQSCRCEESLQTCSTEDSDSYKSLHLLPGCGLSYRASSSMCSKSATSDCDCSDAQAGDLLSDSSILIEDESSGVEFDRRSRQMSVPPLLVPGSIPSLWEQCSSTLSSQQPMAAAECGIRLASGSSADQVGNWTASSCSPRHAMEPSGVRGLHRPPAHSADRDSSADLCDFNDDIYPTEAAFGTSISSRPASLAISVALSTAGGQATDAAHRDIGTSIEAFNSGRPASSSTTDTQRQRGGGDDTPASDGLETAGTSPLTADVEAGYRLNCHPVRPISVTSDYFSAACGESVCSSKHDEANSLLSASFLAGETDSPTAAVTSLLLPATCCAAAIARPSGSMLVGPTEQPTGVCLASAHVVSNRESISLTETTDIGSPHGCHSVGRTVSGLQASEAPAAAAGSESPDDSLHLPSIEQPNVHDMLDDAAAGVDDTRDFSKTAVTETAAGEAVITADVPHEESKRATGRSLQRHSYTPETGGSCNSIGSGNAPEMIMSNCSIVSAEDSCRRVHAQSSASRKCSARGLACDCCSRKLHDSASQRSALPDEQKRFSVLTPRSGAYPFSTQWSAEVEATPRCTLKTKKLDSTTHGASASQHKLNYETITLSPRSRCFYTAESKAGPDGSTLFSETVCISSTPGVQMSSAMDSVNPLHIQTQGSGDIECRNPQPPPNDTSLPLIATDATRLRWEQKDPAFTELPYVECEQTLYSADSPSRSTDAPRASLTTVQEPRAQINNFEPPRCDASEERNSCAAAVSPSVPVLHSDGIQQSRALLRLQFDPIDYNKPRLSQDSVRYRGQRTSRAKNGAERCRSEAKLWIPSPRGRCFSAATAIGIVSSSNDIRDPFSLACTLSAPNLNDDAGASMISALSYVSYSCESTTSTSRSDFSNCFEDDASCALPITQTADKTALLSTRELPPSNSTSPFEKPDLMSAKESGSTADLTEMCAIKLITPNGGTRIHPGESATRAIRDLVPSTCANQCQYAVSEGRNRLSSHSGSDRTSCREVQNEDIYGDQDSGINMQSSVVHRDDSNDNSFEVTFETSRNHNISDELFADSNNLLSPYAAPAVDVSDSQSTLIQSEGDSRASLSTKERSEQLLHADGILDVVDANVERQNSAICLEQLGSRIFQRSTPNDANEQPNTRESPRSVSAPEAAILHVGDPYYSGAAYLGAAIDSSNVEADADGTCSVPVVAGGMDDSPCVEDYSDIAVADSDDSLSVSMQSFGRASVDSSSKLCGSEDSSSCGDVSGAADFFTEQAASLDCSISQSAKLDQRDDACQNVSDEDVDHFTPAAGLSRSVPSIPLMAVDPSSLMNFPSYATGGARAETVHDGRRRCEVAYLPQPGNFRSHSERESSVETLKAAEETDESPSAASLAALRTELLLGGPRKAASSRRRKKGKLRDSRADPGAAASGLGEESLCCLGDDDLDQPQAASCGTAQLEIISTTDLGSLTPSDSSLQLSAASGASDSSDDTDELLQPASFSETAWDSYQERYNTSDLEAEESASAASLAECPQLLCWDDDLSVAAGTEEDIDTVEAGVRQTDPLSGEELAGFRQWRRAAAADDSDSDLDDLCDVLRQSSHQLAMMERIIKKATGDCQAVCVKEHHLGKYVQWLATCRTNLKWLKAIVSHLVPQSQRPVDNLTGVAQQQQQQQSLNDLIARWQQLELKASSLQCLCAQIVDASSVATQVQLKVEKSNQLLAVCSAPSDTVSAHNHLSALKALRKELTDLIVPPGASAVNEHVSRALLAANEQRHQCERRVRSRIRKLRQYLHLWRAFDENRRDLTYLIRCGAAAAADDQQHQAAPASLGAVAAGNCNDHSDVGSLQEGGSRLCDLFAQADALAAAGSGVVSLQWPLCARQSAEQLAAELKRLKDNLAIVGDVGKAPEGGSQILSSSDFGSGTAADEPNSLFVSLEEPVTNATTSAVTDAVPATIAAAASSSSSCSVPARKCGSSRTRTVMAMTAAAVWSCALLAVLLAVYLQPACCDYSRLDSGSRGGSWGLSTEFVNGLPPT